MNSQPKYRDFIESSVAGIFRSTFENGVVLENNQTMKTLFALDSFDGIKSAELYARPVEREYMKEILRQKGFINNMEILYRRLDGSEFWGSHSARYLSEKGIIEGIIVDISSSKWAEEALRKNEIKYRTLFNSANDAIFIWENGTVIDCNPQTLKLFGCTMEELMTGDPPLIFLPLLQADGRNSMEDATSKIMAAAAGDPQFFEWKHAKKDGSLFDAEISLNRIELGGKVLVQVILRDITERKQSEETIRRMNKDLMRRTAELEAVNKELEAFSYSVSHDLRAPLRAIDGFSQALLEDYHDLIDNEGQDFLIRVRKASQRMAALIDDLLRLSRISRTELKYSIIDLSAVVSLVAEELKSTNVNQKFDFIIQPGIEVNGDPDLIRIVIENLLGNACKFTANKNGIIEFGAINHNGNKEFFVKDNGAGFNMAYSNKLFAPFQRLHRDDEFEGTGIGLATVQRIINRHGGYIRAEGNVNKGACFYFTI